MAVGRGFIETARTGGHAAARLISAGQMLAAQDAVDEAIARLAAGKARRAKPQLRLLAKLV